MIAKLTHNPEKIALSCLQMASSWGQILVAFAVCLRK